MKIIGIIMARGGSKGVPGKNIKNLAGKPLIAWTIEEAKKSRYINRLILSTDDEEIASVAKEYGCEVPFMRPAELAQDRTPDLPVMYHALTWLKQNENYEPDVVVHLRPTAPLRRAEHIDKGIRIMLDNDDADAVRSVIEAPKHPLKMWQLEDSRLRPLMEKEGIKDAYNLARQYLQEQMPTFIQNGSVDVVRPKTILEKNSMTGDNIYGFEMSEKESVNIDTPIDFMIAEELMKNR